MSADDLMARIEQARSNHQAAKDQLSEARSSLSAGDIALAGANGGLVGFGGGLLYAATYQNKPTSTGQARLGMPVPKSVNKFKWNRSFHIDFDQKIGPHFNADFGPLGRFNHASIPGWVNELGSTRTLKAIGRGSLGLGLALDAYNIATATPEERSGAIGSAAGGIVGGVAMGAALGSVVPGVGTVIGGLVGGVIGSIGGEYIGDRFF